MIHFDPQGLALADLLAIARQDVPADFSVKARQRIDEGHQLLVKLAAEGTPIYGVNTGLGAAVAWPDWPRDVRVFQRKQRRRCWIYLTRVPNRRCRCSARWARATWRHWPT